MNTSTDLTVITPWKLWAGVDGFPVARKEASKQGFNFFGSDPGIYDERGFPALYGEADKTLAYSGSGSADFFRVKAATEVFLWSDGTIQRVPEVRFPVEAEAKAPGLLPSRRQWMNDRIAAISSEMTNAALNNENIPFEWERELSDLISEVRKLSK